MSTPTHLDPESDSPVTPADSGLSTDIASGGDGYDVREANPDLDALGETRGERPAEWWRTCVVYQIYPRSYADSDGDGMGDLPGITSRLEYVRDLGVDAVWLSPFYPSPMADAGYDVADYRDVEPMFGTLADADALIARAHELGLKFIIDLVPNHTSDQHEWFKAALAAGPESPARERYVFRRGKGENGSEPPNNWRSNFHGPAWTEVEPGWWYLNLFDSAQPDLNWEHPEVRAEFESILRFWCDRGVDGFRVDVAHGLIKAHGLPDWEDDGDDAGVTNRMPMWDQEGVHEIYRRWRQVLDEYNPSGDPEKDRILVAEAWVEPPSRAALYVRPDEMNHGFGFNYLTTPWNATELGEAAQEALHANAAVGGMTTWVLSNHDVIRHASRLGIDSPARHHGGIGPGDPQPDNVLGLRRARAATTFMLGLPGAAYLYQGEELGLPEATMLPDEVRQDPAFHRSGGTDRGRDGCRVPVPWASDQPAFGFNTTGESWLPQPAEYGELAPDRQAGDPGSTLELYRTLLRLRRELRLGEGKLTPLEILPAPGSQAGPAAGTHSAASQVVAFASACPGGSVALVLNTGQDNVVLPAGEVLVSSAPLVDGLLPADAAAWVRTEPAPVSPQP